MTCGLRGAGHERSRVRSVQVRSVRIEVAIRQPQGHGSSVDFLDGTHTPLAYFGGNQGRRAASTGSTEDVEGRAGKSQCRVTEVLVRADHVVTLGILGVQHRMTHWMPMLTQTGLHVPMVRLAIDSLRNRVGEGNDARTSAKKGQPAEAVRKARGAVGPSPKNSRP